SKPEYDPEANRAKSPLGRTRLKVGMGISNPTPLQAGRRTGSLLSRDPALFLVYTMWGLILFEPEWWLASFGPQPLKNLPTVLLPLIVWVAVTKADRRALCWPMGLFLVIHTMALPFAYNRGLAMPLFKTVLLYYAVLVA